MQQSSPDEAAAAARDFTESRALIRTGSRTFYTASLLLPKAVRTPAYGLYAFCRLSDDEVDLGGGTSDEIDRLKARLDVIYAGGTPSLAADRAMARVVRTYAIPRTVPLALIEGLSWDTLGRRYETIEDLYAYAARVAGTVGVMMSLIMGVRDATSLACASHLGVAMQLTNIARDVGEDARNGRLYLPQSWMREAGIDPDGFLQAPTVSTGLRQVVRRLLDLADERYAEATSGIAHLPAACRPAILAARYIYADIGRALAAAAHDSVARRARVSGSRKLRLLGRSLVQAPLLRAKPAIDPLPAVQFLIDAVETSGESRTPHPTGRLVRILEIFERLERAEQAGRPGWIPSITG